MLLATGFLDEFWRDAFAASGFMLAVLGVLLAVVALYIALVQIRRAVTSAQAAAEASETTRRELSRRLELLDLGTALRLVAEAEHLIRSSQFAMAAMRLGDLRSLIVQIRMSHLYPEDRDRSLQSAVGVIASLQDLLFGWTSASPPLGLSVLFTDLRSVSDLLIGLAAAQRSGSEGAT